MKRTILIGLAFGTTHLWAQLPTERSDRLLCEPFLPYAAYLLTFVERAEEVGYIPTGSDAMRRVAAATIGCAESETRLWSQSEADARLAVVERRFQVGISSSVAVRAARIEAEKASYCEAAYSHVTSLVQVYERRKDLGLAHPADVAPILEEIQALVPVCGWSLD